MARMDKHNQEIHMKTVNQQIEFIEGLIAELLAVNSLEYHNKLWLTHGADPKLLNENKGIALITALQEVRRLKVTLNGGTSREG